MKNSPSVILRIEDFIGNLDHYTIGQYRTILLCEKFCQLTREQIKVTFPQDFFAIHTDQFFTGSIEPYKPQFFGLFHEQHDRNIVDNRIEKGMRFFQSVFGHQAIGDIPEHPLNPDDLSGRVAHRCLEDLNVPSVSRRIRNLFGIFQQRSRFHDMNIVTTVFRGQLDGKQIEVVFAS